MDIVLHDVAPSIGERGAIDAVLGPPGSAWEGATEPLPADQHLARGGHAAREQRGLLLPVLHAVHAYAGWISPGALNYICQRLTIPPSDAYGVAHLLRAVLARAPTAGGGAHLHRRRLP